MLHFSLIVKILFLSLFFSRSRFMTGFIWITFFNFRNDFSLKVMEIYSLQNFSCVLWLWIDACTMLLYILLMRTRLEKITRNLRSWAFVFRPVPLIFWLWLCVYILFSIWRALRIRTTLSSFIVFVFLFSRRRIILLDVLRWETEERELGADEEERWRIIGGEEVDYVLRITLDAITTLPDPRRLESALSARLHLKPTSKDELRAIEIRNIAAQLTIALHIWCPKSQVVSK